MAVANRAEPLPTRRAAELACAPPGEQWLIRPLWGRTSVGLLCGHPKLGKSWLLLEIATDGPGFAVDEEPGQLGQALQLPPWLEGRRKEIEYRLTPLGVRDRQDVPGEATSGVSAASTGGGAGNRETVGNAGREERG